MHNNNYKCNLFKCNIIILSNCHKDNVNLTNTEENHPPNFIPVFAHLKYVLRRNNKILYTHLDQI